MKKFVLYSTGCPRCAALKLKLEKMGIDFEYKEDKTGAHILEIGGKSSPILTIDGKLYDFTQAIAELNKLGA